MARPPKRGENRVNAKIRRQLSETIRDLVTPEDFTRALLTIAQGDDPWARKRPVQPDNLPALGGAEPITWSHRMEALRLLLAYAHGQPLQGVVMQAEIQQSILSAGERGPVSFREMPHQIREALRVAAELACGEKLPELPAAPAPPTSSVLESAQYHDAHALSGQVIDTEATDTEEFDLDALDDAPVRSTAVPPIELLFTDSTSVRRALLEDGILTVEFCAAAPDGSPVCHKYASVTPEMMAAWRDAASPGAWFAREIRKQHQRYRCLTNGQKKPGGAGCKAGDENPHWKGGISRKGGMLI